MEGIHVGKNMRFNLITYQRRLRHLKSVALRNLVVKSIGSRSCEILNVESFFTLHCNKESSKAFYTSEKLKGTLNPTWRSFTLNQIEDLDLVSRQVLVRVWVEVPGKRSLVTEWNVDFSGLSYLGDKLRGDSKLPPNTILFGMFDRLFTAPSHSIQVLCHKLIVDQASVRWSYSTNTLYRVRTVQRAIKQTQVTVYTHKRSIEDKLLTSQIKSRKLSEQELAILRVNQLRNELEIRTTLLQSLRAQSERIQSKNHQKDVSVKEKNESLANDIDRLDEKRKIYFIAREKYVKTNAQLIMRKKQLISDLALIYPMKEYEHRVFTICDVRLPNSEEFQGVDDEMIAVSLAFTCHMIEMIAQFLDIPLRYPVLYNSSKSKIRDHITNNSTAEKIKDFPLYSRGKDKRHFQYAVYLLNKNIAQLRFYCGLGTPDLRLTLPNLKGLLELRLGVTYEMGTLRTFNRSVSVNSSSDSPSPMPSPYPAPPGDQNKQFFEQALNRTKDDITIQHNTNSVNEHGITLNFPNPNDENGTNGLQAEHESHNIETIEDHIVKVSGISHKSSRFHTTESDEISFPVKKPFLSHITDDIDVSSGDESSKQYESKFKTWQNASVQNHDSSSDSSGEDISENTSVTNKVTNIDKDTFKTSNAFIKKTESNLNYI